MKSFITSLILICISISANAACDFVHADYLEELSRPNSIQLIKVEVKKSEKFAKNFMKIITDKHDNIPPRLKKYFKADITVIYNFGICSWKGKVKQNGDWRDHIEWRNGKPLQSLNVKLNTGNIMRATKFKLLIPKTRGDLNEVLSTILYRNLGFISPETFKINVDIQGARSEMIFQEDAKKEMLERNYRREGPIFEGDETLIWTDKIWTDKSKKVYDISLARTSNKNWFLKNDQASSITIEAFKRLQLAYLTQSDNIIKVGHYIQPNIKLLNIFNDFHFISLALNANHGLNPHNRRFYYNVFLSEFEPIYYDGDVSFEIILSKIIDLGVFKHSFDKTYNFPYFDMINDPIFYEKIVSDFIIRSKLNYKDADSFARINLIKFLNNAEILQKIIKNYMGFEDYTTLNSENFNGLISRTQDKRINQIHIMSAKIKGEKVTIKLNNGSVKDISKKEMSTIISDMRLKNKRAILTDNVLENRRVEVYLPRSVKGFFIRSEGINVVIDEDHKKIEVTQKNPYDWLLFIGSNFSGWNIDFFGKEKMNLELDQRFNEFGMTGCLNFYDVTFSGTSINTSHGVCEDSVNIVSSQGNIQNIVIKNAFSDAIDIDFSTVVINSVNVIKAGNDCVDVSGGNYVLKHIIVMDCGDKGVSVGEKSRLSINDIIVDGAVLGISSKDLSSTYVIKASFKNTDLCYESTQKKQEFGGAILNMESLSCDQGFKIGDNSRVRVGLE